MHRLLNWTTHKTIYDWFCRNKDMDEKKKIDGWFQPRYVVNDTQASSSVTCDPHTSVSGKSIIDSLGSELQDI